MFHDIFRNIYKLERANTWLSNLVIFNVLGLIVNIADPPYKKVYGVLLAV